MIKQVIVDIQNLMNGRPVSSPNCCSILSERL
jgi:hypothetical protein